MPKIHPTAIVDPGAVLADDVEVGPYSVIESDVTIGAGCRLADHVVVRRYTQMGSGNIVDSFTVLGSLPQDFKFDPKCVSYLRIGDGNVFREGVTISRATGEGQATVIGNRTYWMMTSHAGHNAEVEDDVILVNGAALAGHSRVGRGTILSSHVVVHQFCWVGEGVMTQGNSGVSQHVPPYVMMGFGINRMVGLNTVGLRRNPKFSAEDRRQIKEAFDIYRDAVTMPKILEKMDACEWGAAASRFREFIRKAMTAKKPYNRGLATMMNHRTGRAEEPTE